MNNKYEFPKITIIMPIYNRSKFKPLILFNLKGFDYEKKK